MLEWIKPPRRRPASVSKRRSYDQNCALAIALDLVGERWTLLIIRELLIGARRFGQLQDNLPGIGSNLLSDRLARLADEGIIEKTALEDSGDSGPYPVYQLTDLGRSLGGAVQELIRFGMQFPERRAGTRISRPEWTALPLQAYFIPQQADWRGAYQLEIDGQCHTLSIEAHRLQVTPGTGPDVIGRVAMSAVDAAALAAGQLPIRDALRQDRIVTDLTDDDLQRFFRAFTDPPHD